MAITASALTGNKDTALTSTKTTASVTIHANRLALIAIGVRGSAPVPTVSSVTSTGATWELIRGITFATNAARLEVWRTMVSSDQTGAVTINLSAVPSACLWALEEFNNVTVTGLHGADAVVQSGDESKTTGNGGVVTLSAFGSTDNAGFGTWMSSGVSPNINTGSGFAELHEIVASGGTATLETEWKVNDNSVDAGWSGSSPSAGIAAEIGFATGTNVAQALAVSSTFAPAISKSYGKLLAVDSVFDSAISKAMSKALAVASSFATGFSTFASNLPAHSDVSLAVNSVFTAAMDVLKLGKHGNHSLAHKRKTNHRVWTRKG